MDCYGGSVYRGPEVIPIKAGFPVFGARHFIGTYRFAVIILETVIGLLPENTNMAFLERINSVNFKRGRMSLCYLRLELIDING